MKQPKMSDLEIDQQGTQELRVKMAKSKKIKITLNLDEDVIKTLKQMAVQSGGKYQTLINLMLRESLEKKNNQTSRLDRLEKELQQIKDQLTAA